MIWFGNLTRILVDGSPAPLERIAEATRMQRALERVAEHTPGLAGDALLDALSSTGWIERAAAQRLLPLFRHFDADRHFCEHVRGLSFRGRSAAEEFRESVRQIMSEVLGGARLDQVGPEPCIRFGWGEREGIVLAHPEIGFTLSGRTREAIFAAVEEMPDTLVIVARNFERAAEQQLSGIVHGTGVPARLVTVNLLLGLRATALRYRPDRERVLEVLAARGTLRSPEIARLAEPVLET